MTPRSRNPGDSLFDYTLGRWQWYRCWRGGYWCWSNVTFVWWRHAPEPQLPELIEDYRGR